MIVHEGPGDIFTSGMQTLVCPVNCRGAMGAGLALAFKQRYPGLFRGYWSAYEHQSLTTRRPYLFAVNDGQQVLCLATKDDWRQPSRLEYVRTGLQYVRQYYDRLGITSLAVPMLGCGLGGLDYLSEVRPLIHAALHQLPIHVEILTGQ
jgi:O-acetyl-ADP-ribose deacetylase (regulator of RNase III)